MPGSFSPEATPRQSMKLPEPSHRVTELDSDDEDMDSEKVSSQLLSEAQRRVTPPPCNGDVSYDEVRSRKCGL